MDFEYALPFVVMVWAMTWQFITSRELKTLFWIVVIYICLLSGLRDRVGPDWPGYEQVFTAFANGANKNSQRFYRIVNEVPAVLMIIIVIMVIVKPF